MDVIIKRGYTGFERVGAGGQANVYRTMKDGKEYAIKVVPVQPEDQAKLDEDLRRELSILGGIKHPNCMKVVDLFRSKSRVYISMPFMANGTVGTVVNKHGPLSEWNCKVWFPAMARAVKYLHERSIAHRDLKLDNILLDEHYNPVVSDFGFSRFVKVSNKTGEAIKSDTYCGTTSYNPPEILKHIPYDPFKGDIWCCGVMLFVMINQNYPFDRHDGKEVMYEKQMTREYHLEEEVARRCTDELKDVIALMLEPEVKKRVDIFSLCQHPWFPIILREHELLGMVPTLTTPGSASSLNVRRGS
ncbi:hypothetical protein TYRP_019135 [Tyrophagus putrescentiae]|nr:hypothetical protein TYRP_019135 [Tyrophagus putrescentiae]